MEGTRTGCAVGSRHGCRPPSRGCLAHCLVADSCHKTSHVSEGSVNDTHSPRPQEGHGYCGMSWKRDGLSFRPHVKSPSHLGPHQQPAGTTVPCLAPRAGRGHGSSIHARRQLCAFSGPVLTRTCISPCSVHHVPSPSAEAVHLPSTLEAWSPDQQLRRRQVAVCRADVWALPGPNE